MPVFTVTSDGQDVDPKTGKPYRHVNQKCPGFTKYPESSRAEVRNTEALRERTVRCPLAGDWDEWEKTEKERADKRNARGQAASTGRTSSSKAAPQPAQAQGGDAQKLADRAKAGRQRPRARKRQKATA